MAEIALDRCRKRFGDVEAVADLSLTIADGEFVVLLGPTGAGKTTTLRLVAGLERPDARHDPHRRARRDERPSRRSATSPSCSSNTRSIRICRVYDNLAFPLRSPPRRMPEAEIRTRVTEIARLLRIEDKLAEHGDAALRRRRCSASPSAARWCAGRRSTSWTSRSPRSTRSSAPTCASS